MNTQNRIPKVPRIVGRSVAVTAVAMLALPLGVTTVAASDGDQIDDPFLDQLEAICDTQDLAGATALGFTIVTLGALDDTYVGGAANEAIFAGPGDDKVDGAGGRDLICLGTGDDRGRGGSGGDWVFGEEGDDRIRGNTGSDFLSGGDDFDSCIGDAGLDATDGTCEVWVP